MVRILCAVAHPSSDPQPARRPLSARRAEATDLKEKFLKSAVITRFMQLKDFDAFVKADIEKQAQIVKAAGIAAQ